MSDRPYHHGHLRAALLDAAVARLAEEPPSALSLRQLARDVGVSHAAPTHHFGDKNGLLVAVATQGFELLRGALAAAWDETADFLEVGVAYVVFAVEHPVHFGLMFGPDLAGAAELDEQRRSTRPLLHGPSNSMSSERDAATAAWAIAHGLAALLVGHQISDRRGTRRLASDVLGRLYAEGRA